MDESEATSDKEASRFVWRAFIAIAVIIVTSNFASEEQVAKWATWKLEWPAIAYYGVAMAGWVVGMILTLPRLWVSSLFGGPIAGACVTYLAVAYLEAVDTSHTAILGLLYVLGAVPGLVVYVGVTLFLHWLNLVLFPDDDETPDDDDEGVQ